MVRLLLKLQQELPRQLAPRVTRRFSRELDRGVLPQPPMRGMSVEHVGPLFRLHLVETRLQVGLPITRPGQTPAHHRRRLERQSYVTPRLPGQRRCVLNDDN
jgi:hypothetical protein